jgi:hypothetical protein
MICHSASTVNRSSPPLEILKMAYVQVGDCFCLQYLQSRSPSLRSSGRNVRLWDNPLPEARIPGKDWTTHSISTANQIPPWNGLSQSLAFLPEDLRLGERDWDLARAPRRTARKKGSGYENGSQIEGQSQSFHAYEERSFSQSWYKHACLWVRFWLQEEPSCRDTKN